MRSVKFEANLKRATMVSPEEGGVSYLTNVLTMNKPDRKALAGLCEKPDEALKALDAVLDANGKTEIPCGGETCAMTLGAGTKSLDTSEAKFKKVVLDARGGECQMRIIFQMPKTVEAVMFLGRMLGCDLEVKSVPQQGTIDDEVEKKAKKAPAAVESN